MTTFYVFRHGDTYNSKFFVPYPPDSSSINIIPETVPTITRLAKYLINTPSEINYSSEYLRCRQTAAIVNRETEKEFIFDKRLIEYENESFEEFRDRITNFLEEIKQKNYNNVLICTHGAVVAAIKNLLITNKFEESLLKDYPPTGVLMTIKNHEVKYIDFNI